MSGRNPPSARRIADALVEECGRTYAEEAGIRLKDTPQPLYQLLVLSLLLSARIRASVAVAAARALFGHGMRTPRRMVDATWQQRVDALGKATTGVTTSAPPPSSVRGPNSSWTPGRVICGGSARKPTVTGTG